MCADIAVLMIADSAVCFYFVYSSSPVQTIGVSVLTIINDMFVCKWVGEMMMHADDHVDARGR